MKAHASKMHIAYLKLHNIKIPGKLANKKYAVWSHKESTSKKAKNQKRSV